MIQIRPVSDLRNKFPEIETLVNSGNPVYLTKNGYAEHRPAKRAGSRRRPCPPLPSAVQKR